MSIHPIGFYGENGCWFLSKCASWRWRSEGLSWALTYFVDIFSWAKCLSHTRLPPCEQGQTRTYYSLVFEDKRISFQVSSISCSPWVPMSQMELGVCTGFVSPRSQLPSFTVLTQQTAEYTGVGWPGTGVPQLRLENTASQGGGETVWWDCWEDGQSGQVLNL